MGNPRYPTQAQVRKLNRVAVASSAESVRLSHGTISLNVPVNGVVLLEVAKKASSWKVEGIGSFDYARSSLS